MASAKNSGKGPPAAASAAAPAGGVEENSPGEASCAASGSVAESGTRSDAGAAAGAETARIAALQSSPKWDDASGPRAEAAAAALRWLRISRVIRRRSAAAERSTQGASGGGGTGAEAAAVVADASHSDPVSMPRVAAAQTMFVCGAERPRVARGSESVRISVRSAAWDGPH